MCTLRAEKIKRIEAEIPPTEIDGPSSGELLVVGWGGTKGAIKESVREARSQGHTVSRIHLQFMNPLPPDLGKILKSFKQILVPEINFGQLRSVLRDKYLVDARGFNRMTGQPLKVGELTAAIINMLKAH